MLNIDIFAQAIEKKLIKNRCDLFKCINALDHLHGPSVEVGVDQGLFSLFLIKNTSVKRLFSIDCWEVYQSPDSKSNIGDISFMNERYCEAVNRLASCGQRSCIMRMYSEEASPMFKDDSLDFVFLDADHTYKSVKRDLELWYPKVKSKKYFIGHDYCQGTTQYGETFGVIEAVNEFCKLMKLRCVVTPLPDGYNLDQEESSPIKAEKLPTWMIIKP